MKSWFKTDGLKTHQDIDHQLWRPCVAPRLSSLYTDVSVQQHTSVYKKRYRGSGEASGRSSDVALRLYIKQYVNLILFPPLFFSPWRFCVTVLRLYIKEHINLFCPPILFSLDGLVSLLSVWYFFPPIFLGLVYVARMWSPSVEILGTRVPLRQILTSPLHSPPIHNVQVTSVLLTDGTIFLDISIQFLSRPDVLG
jgi:hypothetical protein